MNSLVTAVFEGDRPSIGSSAFQGNLGLTTVTFLQGATGWPGATIQSITPTPLSAPMPATVTAVPALPTIPAVLLSLSLMLMVFKVRKHNFNS